MACVFKSDPWTLFLISFLTAVKALQALSEGKPGASPASLGANGNFTRWRNPGRLSALDSEMLLSGSKVRVLPTVHRVLSPSQVTPSTSLSW